MGALVVPLYLNTFLQPRVSENGFRKGASGAARNENP